MKGKIYKILLYVLLFAALAASLWNKIQLEKCKTTVGRQIKVNDRLRHDAGQLENAVIKSSLASIMHLGKTLSWQNIKKIYPSPSSEDPQVGILKRPRLVLVFSELSCNVCQDSEAAFAVTIAEKFGEESVLAVVQATNMRYIRSFIRLNRVNFPVYYCIEDVTFFKINEMMNTPMVFGVDEAKRILAAHFPIPGQHEHSAPSHEYCFNDLEKCAGD